MVDFHCRRPQVFAVTLALAAPAMVAAADARDAAAAAAPRELGKPDQ